VDLIAGPGGKPFDPHGVIPGKLDVVPGNQEQVAYLDRVRDPGQGTPLVRGDLVAMLTSLIREIEAVPGQVAAANTKASTSASRAP
jgi:hypothetical protein